MSKKTVFIFLSSLIFSIIMFSTASYAANVVIESHKQQYSQKDNTTTFDGNVKVGVDNIKVKSPKAFVKMDAAGNPNSAKFINGAYAIKDDGPSQSEVKANTITMTLLDKKIVANGQAKSMVSENKKPVLTMKSEVQEFDSLNDTIKASGGVVMNYKDIATNSSTLLINMNKEGKPQKVVFNGSVKIVEGKNIINANNVIFNPVTNDMIANGNVRSKTILDDGTLVLITSDNQQYNKASNTMLSSGHVKVVYKDYVAFGPKAMILSDKTSSKPNKIMFIGRSNIKEGSRQIEADRIEIIMDPKNFSAEGDVRTRFVQEQLNTDANQSSKGKKQKKNASQPKYKVKSLDADLSNGSSFDKNFQSGLKTENVPDLQADAAKVNKSTHFKKLSGENN